MQRWIGRLAFVLAVASAGALWTTASAQVTTGSVRGTVTDEAGAAISGARVTAVHTPSGTQYIGVTRADGRFQIPGMRVGGPYAVAVQMIGFARQSRDDIMVSLGVAADLQFRLSAIATTLQAVTVTSEGGEMSSTRTGAATAVRREQLEQLPTISRRLGDFTRLTPQASGSSFAGQDNRLNNITVDGSYFNNSFGLGGQPGDRTGVSPISLDAIEAVQVNIAPFDVRQGAFTGAAVNTITKSGTNEWSGSVYLNNRDESYVGRDAGAGRFNPGTFTFDQFGFRIGGPILKNKLFFFLSYESDELASPATTFVSNPGGGALATGNVTRVLKTDLDNLATLLTTNFGYNPGGYEDYPGLTPSTRLTAKLDFALSDRHKFSLRMTNLDSETDVLTSTSSSLGFGRTRNNLWLGFQGSNYTILENIQSIVGEWNALIGDRMSNQMIIGRTAQDESRGPISTLFPFVDILGGDIVGGGGSTYTSFGAEPFTPNNELRYSSVQFQNNFTLYGNRHDLTFGLSVELYESENVFFPGKQSSYVYNSLTDFLADAGAYTTACGTNPASFATCAGPATSAAGVGPRRFQVRYSNINGQTKPVQPLEVMFSGVYAQDEWRVRNNLTVTAGLRVDMATFGATGEENTAVNAMTFRDENGDPATYNTAKLPDATPLISPRVGFNWDLRGNGQTVLRGGTGMFTGRPAYVWISNQIGNNGILTGFIQDDGSPTGTELTNRPFHPDPDRYKPTLPAGAPVPAASYELALTNPDFKFPQLWRTNLAVDHRFESGWRGTLEFLWGQDVNGVYYINANLPAADSAFSAGTGGDTRPRWVSDKCLSVAQVQTNRINCTITSAVVMKNQDVGRSYNAALSIERAFRNGFFTKFATAFGTSDNTVDPGSIAFGSWNNNQHAGDPNNPGVGSSGNYQGRRSFLVTSYTRDWFGWGNTSLSMFLENRTIGNSSYVYGGDLNGDGGTSNDLLYVPTGQSQMNFATSGTFTPAMQAAAWDAYISQDPYLRNRRGKFAERGGLVLPTITRMDVSVSQDISRMIMGQRNALQIRLDVLNFTNMLNSDWGLARVPISTSPLIPVAPLTTGPNAGQSRYTMRVINGALMSRTFQKTAGESDVWRMQLGLRYTFN